MATNDQKLQYILDQLKKFNFEFYGYDENSKPLVKGPNGQVIDVNVAINFVNQQINNKNQSSGGLESGPVFTESVDSKRIDKNIDSSLEKPKDEPTQSQGEDDASPTAVQNTAPKIKLSKPKQILYGDGFDPQSFDPASINSTLKFIESNSKKNHTKSDKWLAILFEKFVREQKQGLKRPL